MFSWIWSLCYEGISFHSQEKEVLVSWLQLLLDMEWNKSRPAAAVAFEGALLECYTATYSRAQGLFLVLSD